MDVRLGWRIGNGLTCTIWTSNWIPEITSFKSLSHKLTMDSQQKISELISNLGNSVTWGNNKLKEFFHHVDIERITAIPLLNLEIPSILAWFPPLGW